MTRGDEASERGLRSGLLPRRAETERSIDRCPVHLQARGHLFDRHLGIGEQFPRVADLLRRQLGLASALATSGSRCRQSRHCALADQIAFHLGEPGHDR